MIRIVFICKDKCDLYIDWFIDFRSNSWDNIFNAKKIWDKVGDWDKYERINDGQVKEYLLNTAICDWPDKYKHDHRLDT